MRLKLAGRALTKIVLVSQPGFSVLTAGVAHPFSTPIQRTALFAPPPTLKTRRTNSRHYKLPVFRDHLAMVVWEDMWTKDGGLKAGTYFDAAGSSKVLLQVLAQKSPHPSASALVPGCGRGYDVIEMAKIGYQAVGVEIAPSALVAATEYNKECLEKEGVADRKGSATFIAEDFFKIAPPAGGFDLIYDYTFLCALDPSQRGAWAENMARLIKPGEGELITLIFPLGDYAGGPPHAMSKELVSGLLTAQGFEATYLEPVSPQLSHAGRGGKEMLGRWRLVK